MLGIFLDTETSGLNSQTHHILEIAYKIIDLKTGEIKATYETIIAWPESAWKQSDQRSLGINGFTWEKVCQGKKPPAVSQEIIAQFKHLKIHRKSAVFICQNPSFDRSFFSQLIDPKKQEELEWPYHWLDLASMHWALSMKNPSQGFPWDIGLSKDSIAKHYHLPPGAPPPRALNGVTHLLDCYEALVGFPEKQSC
jgi:DNA polymerase-3 subunit epsilon/oligoribonuclease